MINKEIKFQIIHANALQDALTLKAYYIQTSLDSIW